MTAVPFSIVATPDRSSSMTFLYACRCRLETRSTIVSLACLFVVMAPSFVHAQGVGFIGGGTIDPEGFFVGTFFETPPVASSVRVRPGVDGSWGDGLRVASINFDIIHRADVGSTWQFYTGGGPSVLITRVDASSLPAGVVDDVSAAFGAVIGFSHSGGFLTEFKYGYSSHNGGSLKIGAGFKIGRTRTATP